MDTYRLAISAARKKGPADPMSAFLADAYEQARRRTGPAGALTKKAMPARPHTWCTPPHPPTPRTRFEADPSPSPFPHLRQSGAQTSSQAYSSLSAQPSRSRSIGRSRSHGPGLVGRSRRARDRPPATPPPATPPAAPPSSPPPSCERSRRSRRASELDRP